MMAVSEGSRGRLESHIEREGHEYDAAKYGDGIEVWAKGSFTLPWWAQNDGWSITCVGAHSGDKAFAVLRNED